MPGPAEASSSRAHLHAPNRRVSDTRDPLDPDSDYEHDKMEETRKEELAKDQDQDEEDVFDPFSIDPAYRLRTTRTAHSVIAESIRSEAAAEGRKKRRLFASMKRKKTVGSGSVFKFKSGRARSSTMTTVSASEHGGSSIIPSSPDLLATPLPVLSANSHSHSPESPLTPGPSTPLTTPSTPNTPPTEKKDFFKRWFTAAPRPLTRRTVFVNLPLPAEMLKKGEPITRYVRNKVRTSKYTLITFLPKNLFEQFRRVANIYFLALVILQLFSIFGAPNAQIGMLPLLFILGMTAIKDGIEDWRRASLDNEVNNSATTKLGSWRNTNQPTDPRTWIERFLGIGSAPGKMTKGVRKLRAAEASAGKQIVQEQNRDLEEELDGGVDKATYDMNGVPEINVSAPTPLPDGGDFEVAHMNRISMTPSIPSTTMSKRSHGVLDWNQRGTGTAQWERTLWKKLEVGDMVMLKENEQVPADIIVLSTSNPDNLCFVETKNLDGETNLKVRKPLKATSRISSEEDLEHAHFYVDSEAPHANLYTYNGVLRYRQANDRSNELKMEAITINELLLRGCTMRNTKWIIGLVVFTGADTKIMLNGGDTPSKRSKIEKETNFNVAMNFALLMILCLAVALLHGYYVTLGSSADYYEIGARAAENIYLDSVIIFFSCLIVFQNIVPISLYITIEVVKTIQAFFIFQDIEMYYADYDTPCVPKTWNISDDLGQIEYVFSDKTGTLTQNVMEFKKCSIQGVPFGEGMTEAMLGAAKRDGREMNTTMDDQNEQMAVLKTDMLETMKHTISNRYLRDEHLTLIAPELPKRMIDHNDSLRPHIINFFTALAICHTVLSDAPDTSKPTILDYKAESPDEAALVAAARDVGFPFVTRNSSRIDIEVLGKAERWTPLRVLEFNSSRKRMSVIVRDPDNRLVLFCKGADSVIYQRLASDHDQTIKDKTLADLETFANGGLRTLCIAWRHLEESEYAEWVQEYDTACAAVTDREDAIERSCENIEHSLSIIGATALEDKLQEGVPDAIAMLHQAGIKLWILTGDKLQTAIEIGYSCNLLTNDMEVMIISADSEEGARAQIEAGLNKIASVLGPPDVNLKKKGRKIRPLANFAVVIDGESLRYALTPALKPLFLTLGTQCAAVICCRVSPSQKALTVRLVKEGCNAMTLSIGDGANDVAMIQEANVGVGLFGLEGSQAAMSADYAFGQFRFLTRLLLVHGRWSYVRIADMHANFFYKNVIWTISMFWFQIFNGFDATYLFEYTLLLLYNLVFTSLPVGILGALDQDTNAQASLAFPQLYRRGMMGLDYTRTRFWLYMGDGLYQSAILFFIPFLCYGTGHTWSSDGRDTNGLNEIGSTIAVAGVITANLYVGINTRYWTVITWLVYVISTLLVYIWIPIYSVLSAFPYYGEAEVIYPTFNFWFVVILTVCCCVGPRWLVLTFRNSYFPRDKEIVREAWVAGDLKRELGLKRRRQRKAEKKRAKLGLGPGDDQDHDHDHDQDHDQDQDLTDMDAERGGYSYEQAGMTSPLRERPRSPLLSDSGTPRGPFSYPPSPAKGYTDPLPSTSSYQHQNAPPPLSLRKDSNVTPPYATPTSGISYTSPTALETINMATEEVRRMDDASNNLKRSSLSIPGPSVPSPAHSVQRPNAGSRRGSRESWHEIMGGGGSSRRGSPPYGDQRGQSYPLAPIISHEPVNYGGARGDDGDDQWNHNQDRDRDRDQRNVRDSTGAGYGYAV